MTAVCHESCYLKFTNDGLKGAQKRTSAVSAQLSPRRNLDTSMQEPNCFFCNELDGEMHKTSTRNVDTHVSEYAQNFKIAPY